jgi:ribosomal protein S18 acetylase RimI-like enzyme
MNNDLMGPVRLDETHIELAAEQLSRAFQNYPVFVYVYPDDSERKDRLPHFFKSMVHKGLLQGEVYASSPAMEGVTVWLPPGISGGLSKAFEVDREAFDRFSYYGKCAYGVRQKHAPAQHWFLELIGVVPEFQGKGFGGRLLRPMLDRLEQESLPCYLDTEVEENVAIYQRHGFRVLDYMIVPGTEVRSWGMLRE